MKKLLALTAISVMCTALPLFSGAQQSAPAANNTPAPAAKKTYEMKQYWFVMLTRGARRNEITDTTVLNKLQEGHMKNMEVMANAGKLTLAGPFGDDGNWRGLFIFNAATKEEVEALLKNDPAIAAGRLDYEIHPWWTAKNCHFQ